MESKFNFFEVVKVTSENKDLSDIVNKEGVVLGKSEHDNGVWGYSVSIEGICLGLDEMYLQATGKFEKREKFYDGSTMRVSSKGELISMNIVDQEEE